MRKLHQPRLPGHLLGNPKMANICLARKHLPIESILEEFEGKTGLSE